MAWHECPLFGGHPPKQGPPISTAGLSCGGWLAWWLDLEADGWLEADPIIHIDDHLNQLPRWPIDRAEVTKRSPAYLWQMIT